MLFIGVISLILGISQSHFDILKWMLLVFGEGCGICELMLSKNIEYAWSMRFILVCNDSSHRFAVFHIIFKGVLVGVKRAVIFTGCLYMGNKRTLV